MLLENKTAIIYGGGGVAPTFAREGAAVFLAGRTREPMEAAAADMAARDGDEAAFAELVARHRRELHVHCDRTLGWFEEAEDRCSRRSARHRPSDGPAPGPRAQPASGRRAMR